MGRGSAARCPSGCCWTGGRTVRASLLPRAPSLTASSNSGSPPGPSFSTAATGPPAVRGPPSIVHVWVSSLVCTSKMEPQGDSLTSLNGSPSLSLILNPGGLVGALVVLLERLRREARVDVFQTAKGLQNQRPGLLKDFVCSSILPHHIEEDSNGLRFGPEVCGCFGPRGSECP